MKKILFLLLVPVLALAQSANQNYVKTITYKDSTQTNKNIKVTYYDGLGRPIQQIANAQSNTGKNIVTHMEYDAFGRQTKEYLPYKSDSSTLDYVTDPLSALLPYYSSPSSSVNGNPNQEATNNPYSEKELENSPLNRVLKQAAPGATWALGSGHEIKMDYQTNADTEVKYFKATTDWSATNLSYGISTSMFDGYYNANELYKTITKDENWTSGNNNTTQEFKNKDGQVVLKRTFNGEAYNTYYIYDEYGNLTYVLPPLAETSISATLDVQSILDGLCYQYKYDDRNRLVAKKLPGKQWEFIVYDKQDRPVATGPSFSPWGNGTVGMMITEYDAFGRVTQTGWRAFSVSETARGGWQSTINSGSNPFVLVFNDFLTKNFYDDYSYSYAPTPGQNFVANIKGLPTGSWARVLTSPALGINYIEMSSVLYDTKYRPTRTYTANYFGGYTQVDTKLDFMGKTLRTITRHQHSKGDTEMVITDTFTYTAQDRLALHKQQVDDMPEELIASNTYDELGQLVSKKVGGTVVDGTVGLQKVDYAYNIRGWLKSINDVGNLSGTDPSQLGTDPVDLFAFKLSYQDNDVTAGGSAPTVSPLYNGNISESYWRTANDNVMRKYAYSYDPLNRLLNAAYSKPESAIYTNSFMEDISYDQNGNIMSLLRNGGMEDENYEYNIDNLEYKYKKDTNQLMKVYDASGSPQGFSETKDAISRGGIDTYDDYTYDANGNMTKDDNKGITSITYNHLNLPTKIIFNTTNTKIEYLYDALGQKKGKSVTYMKAVDGEASKAAGPVANSISYVQTTDQTDYMAGGFQYKNTALQFFPHAEGYVNSNQDKTFTYVFNYTDHLGNSRISYSDADLDGYPEIVEENNYYPFGLKHQGYNDPAFNNQLPNPSDGSSNSAPYKYKYNGKELQDELGLNLYDYGARNYDAAIGRWMNMDAFAEKYFPLSPYTYALNNPMFFVDPDGNEIDIYYGKDNKEKVKYGYQKGRNYSKIKDGYLADTYKALDALYESSNIEVDGKQTNLMQTLMDDKRELSVVEGGEDGGSNFSKERSYPDAGDGSTKTKNNIGTIYFNRKEGVMYNDTNDAKNISDLYDNNGKLKSTTKINSPTSVLGHEIGHAFNFATNPTEYIKRKADISTRNLTPYFRNAEEAKATTLSTQININLGEFPRRNYYATGVQTTGVLSNKEKKP